MLPLLLICSAGALLLALVALLLAGRWIAVQLMLKYLLKRRLAWIAIGAVMLCVWLVLVVNSVMGGWLRMFEESYKSMSGDLVIGRTSMQGFEGYEAIIDEVKKLPEVAGAIPVIRTFGIFSLETGYQDYVFVIGLPSNKETGELQLDGVLDFEKSLWIQNLGSVVPRFVDYRKPSFALWPGFDYQLYAMRVENAERKPGAIVGGTVVGIIREKGGVPDWNRKFSISEATPVPRVLIKVTVAPPDRLGSGTAIPQSSSYYWVVDGSRTQLPQHDKSIYVPFDALQRQMDLQGQEYIEQDPVTKQDRLDADGNPIIRRSPPRTTEIHIRLRDPAQTLAAKGKVQEIVGRITGDSPGMRGGVRVQTWREQQETMIGAIQNEINLTTTLFAFISLVAVFMIFAIFYMIVMEKTRDIGIIKSCGAPAWTIASIFLGYGAFIGLVGGGLGVLVGWLTVLNINEIHTLLGKVTGAQIWSAETYAFDLIPNRVNPWSAAIVAVFAVLSAVVGAIVPALKAALQKPVDSLRFE